MLQQLAQQTGTEVWTIASMLFFMSVFTLIVVRLQRTPWQTLRAQAQLPLDEPEVPPSQPRSQPR